MCVTQIIKLNLVTDDVVQQSDRGQQICFPVNLQNFIDQLRKVLLSERVLSIEQSYYYLKQLV